MTAVNIERLNTSIVVSEIFGPTIQGEGPTAGKPAMFVRLGRCNLSCSWCDTPYTWDWRGQNGIAYDPAHELRRMTIEDVIAELDTLDRDGIARRVVISGGEPLLQRTTPELIAWLLERYDVEIETNGTRRPSINTTGLAYNVSPKLSGAGMTRQQRIVPAVLDEFAAWARTGSSVAFKFVITRTRGAINTGDVDEVAALVREFDIPQSAVWVMPEGRREMDILRGLRALAPVAIAHGWNLSSRLHVLTWGDERAR